MCKSVKLHLLLDMLETIITNLKTCRGLCQCFGRTSKIQAVLLKTDLLLLVMLVMTSMSKAFPLSGFHILTGGSYFTTTNAIVEEWLSTRFDFHRLMYQWWVLACGCISYRSCWKKFHILKGLWTSHILEIRGPSIVFVADFMGCHL